jgi:3-deoxy-D-manno-octulosonate 8-phosphate phosphatase (KDO 8-P phosphatase)
MSHVIYSPSLIQKAKLIQLLICDVDGVLSDGKLSFNNHQEESKSFNVKDGLGIKQLLDSDITVAIITGRQSNIVTHRAMELGIPYVYQNQPSKIMSYNLLLKKCSLEPCQVMHVGDDLPDLPLMKRSGLGVCVADAYPFLKEHADWITQNKGGNGAIREASDLILQAKGLLTPLYNRYLNE